MARKGKAKPGADIARKWKALASIVMVLGLNACDDNASAPVVLPPPPPVTPPPPPPPPPVTPAGRLVQTSLRGPLSHTTASGWRTEIRDGTITVRPPASAGDTLQYSSRGTHEWIGAQDLRAWAGDRRSIALPGGAKLTMRGQGGQILRMSIYDGDESHEIDVLTQTIMHSQVSTSVATTRDDAEHDGETAALASTSFVNWLYFSNIYTQGAGADGAPQARVTVNQPLARQYPDGVHSYAAITVAPLEADAICAADGQARGGLVRGGTGAMTYTSRSGHWTLRIDRHTITLTRAGKFLTWEVWGDPHENLNGKHIKDWELARRTLLLPDGLRITMHAEGPQHVVHTTSIYDGAQSHEIGNSDNSIRHSCINAATAREREARELDGETAYIANLIGPGVTQGSMLSWNVYNETGTVGASIFAILSTLLGETGVIDTQPNQINDFYDDPRLGHS